MTILHFCKSRKIGYNYCGLMSIAWAKFLPHFKFFMNMKATWTWKTCKNIKHKKLRGHKKVDEYERAT